MKDDSAFPRSDHGPYMSRGISKREYFAAAALTGLLANPFIVEATLNAKNGNSAECAKEIREQAFACADSMILESEKAK